MMKQLILLFAFATSLAFSAGQEQYIDKVWSGEPSSLVDGKVSVITGDYFIHDHELIVQGHEPIVLKRAYSGSNVFQTQSGWHYFFPHLFVKRIIRFEEKYQKWCLFITHEQNGIPVTYFSRKFPKKTYHPDPLPLGATISLIYEGKKELGSFPRELCLSPIPIPLEFQQQLLKLYEHDPVRPLGYSREE